MRDIWLRFPGGRVKALTLSYDDGVEQDVRLMDIMKRHGLKGTFNLNGGQFAPEGTVYPEGQIHRRMTLNAAKALYSGSGQEVALHALWHGDLPNVPAAHALWQVLRDKETLEEAFGGIIRGMAYPYGTATAELARTLSGCGVAYSRTVRSTHGFELPENWLLWDATCHHNDPRLMELTQRFVTATPFRAQLFYLWGHSYEFEANDNWQVIEEFAAYAGGHDEIWYATNQEICDYVQAWRSMHASADGRRLYNPTATTLYLLSGGKAYTLSPGEGICLP